MLIWGLLALSLDLVLGYLGLLSFGHAAFIGVGAYITGLSLIHVSPSFPVALLVTVVVTTTIAWLVGALSIRFHGVYFAITTLAIAQIFYQLSINLTDITGGTNGLTGIPTPEILNMDVGGTVPFYFITLLLAVVIYAGLVHVINSSFGRVMVALRESERRTAFLGYNTDAVKRRAFALSGLVAGVAGVLFAGLQGFITPSILFWPTSGDALFAVTLGGMGTLFGPILGGMSFVGLEQVLSSYLDAWRFVVGLVLVVVVMFAPRGLISIRTVVKEFLRDRRVEADESDEEDLEIHDPEAVNPSGGQEK
jgi:branched-chain amino acid transport system permease protein